MDKVLDDVLDSMQSESTDTSQSENQNDQGSYEGSELDLDLSDFEEEETSEAEPSSNADESDDASEAINNFANSSEKNAFAAMRVQNKELQKTIDELDLIAKGAGLSGYEEFLAKAKENSVAKQAKDEGISVELAKKLNTIDEKLEAIDKREQDSILEGKKAKLAGTLNSFIKSNNLNDSIVGKLSDDLEKDGFTIEQLMDMPETALNRLFSAYTNVNVQKNLDKKSSITQEMPINQTSKIDGDTINKQLDNLVKEIMGRE